jgi:putative phosphoesterase
VRIGFVSDAHGNPEGLSVCLKFLKREGVEKIYFLGDAVGYMPDWSGVFTLLDKYEVQCIQGNHDYMSLEKTIDPKKNLVYKLTSDLVEANLSYLSRAATWPSSLAIDIANRKLLLVHGSPLDPLNGYVYQDTSVEAFESISADVVFMGQTHRPFIKWAYGKCLVNVGSCGLPRDVGNLASCALYDVDKGEGIIYRVPFDVEMVIKSYEGHIHKSVVDCLYRRADNYFGVLVS